MRTYYFLKQGQSLQRISLEGDPPGVVEVLPIGPIGSDCKVNVSFNLDGAGLAPSILCHDRLSGTVFYFWDNGGKYERSPVLGQIPPEWQLQMFRVFDYGGTQIFGHYRGSNPDHPDYGRVQIWNVNNFSNPFRLGNINGQFELMLGDVNGDSSIDIVGRRIFDTALGRQGDLAVWYMGLDSRGPYITEVLADRGNIGLAWKIQVADMNSDGYADIFGYNEAGDLWVWHNVADAKGKRGLFNAGHSYGKLGSDWQDLQVTSLRTAFPPSVDILGLAPSNGEVHGWFTNGTGIIDAGVTVGSNARNWIPVAGLPQTRFV